MKALFTVLAVLFLVTAGRAQGLLGQTFHANGRLESTRFTDGAVERFITYYEDGRVRAMGSYHNGRRHGVWREFDESGVLLAEARFVDGRRQGTWEFRDHANAVVGHLQYEDGLLAQGEVIDPATGSISRRHY